MPEKFLHYVWKFGYFNKDNLSSISGQSIEITSPGVQNFDAGPDFLNASLLIDNVHWYGNIEIHVNASDWIKHQHVLQEGYSNLILHVVYYNDKVIEPLASENIPTIELNTLINTSIFNKFLALKESTNSIPCSTKITNLDPLTITSMIEKAAIERLTQKSAEIKRLLNFTNNNWEECLYVLISKYLGVKVNQEPFERMARSLSLNIISKHLDNLQQVEALLYGQSGLLPTKSNDSYVSGLISEYHFLQKKYSLVPLNKHIWKFARMRPIGFPTIRISLLASLLYNHHFLFSRILNCSEPKAVLNLLNCSASPYWTIHYVFNKESKALIKKLGTNTKSMIVINAIAPLLYLYGLKTDDHVYIDRAIKLLELLKPEQNKIIRQWQSINISPNDAFQSQGLIELNNNYCVYNRCIDCRIGHKIINTG